MRLAVTGSIATDHLMTFPGKFSDSLVADQLEHISLSFLVDDLDIRRGGVAANIAFGWLPRAAAGAGRRRSAHDFADYRAWLDRHGVDTASVHVSELRAHGAVHLHDRLRGQPDRVVLPRRDERGQGHRARAGRWPASAGSTSC